MEYEYFKDGIKGDIEKYGIFKRRDPTHLFYMPTSYDYGYYPPSKYTQPKYYFPLSQRFSSRLQIGGNYRNYSLNVK
ncbi:UPF0691 protein C9orf116 [Diaphorina citri]|uniref:UPF0691 protein C9orf116 n=1 Tax=Diaphorina citri TaxID=121845 RepID=A0A1S3DUS3_DIACI|nr:UPF0691 protein C9orf116 [Diaphorina citri]KAI5712039.1 hypothetical protein M8J75_005240 [Diaphorina citri]KAI5754522.1 hypothetical protein M8J77_009211 [Diaphorina citri]